MKICLDLRYLVKSGSSSYIANVVPRILALDRGNDYYIARYASQTFAFENQVKGVFVCRARRNVTRMLWTIFVLPLRMALAGVDVYHGMKFPGPWFTTAKTVNTLHSISSKYKGWFPRSLRARIFQFYADPLMRRSDAVIAVSRFLSDFAVESIGVAKEKICVVYHGVDRVFRLLDKASVDAAREKYGLSPRYLMCVGNVFRVKNQLTAVRAFAEVASEFDGELVLVGGTHDRYCDEVRREAQRLKVADRVKFLGFVSGLTLVGLMNGAVADLLPSLTEGFGMAMLEAFACGLPVIAARVGSLPELGENCALYVDDPMDHRGFARELRRLFASPAFLEEVRLRSAARGAAFTWEAAAAEHVRIYHAVGKTPSGGDPTLSIAGKTPPPTFPS